MFKKHQKQRFFLGYICAMIMVSAWLFHVFAPWFSCQRVWHVYHSKTIVEPSSLSSSSIIYPQVIKPQLYKKLRKIQYNKLHGIIEPSFLSWFRHGLITITLYSEVHI